MPAKRRRAKSAKPKSRKAKAPAKPRSANRGRLVVRSKSGQEKRRIPRLEVFLPVTYTQPKSLVQKGAESLSSDIGAGGLGMLLKRKVKNGTHLRLKIFVPGRIRQVVVVGQVVRCLKEKNPRERGYRWRAGLRFHGLDSQGKKTIQKLVKRYFEMAGSGRRPR